MGAYLLETLCGGCDEESPMLSPTPEAYSNACCGVIPEVLGYSWEDLEEVDEL